MEIENQANGNSEANASGADKADKSGLMDKVGGAIEKLGHKVSDAGAETLGQKIHDLGDKLETEHKNPEHPHNV